MYEWCATLAPTAGRPNPESMNLRVTDLRIFDASISDGLEGLVARSLSRDKQNETPATYRDERSWHLTRHLGAGFTAQKVALCSQEQQELNQEVKNEETMGAPLTS